MCSACSALQTRREEDSNAGALPISPVKFSRLISFRDQGRHGSDRRGTRASKGRSTQQTAAAGSEDEGEDLDGRHEIESDGAEAMSCDEGCDGEGHSFIDAAEPASPVVPQLLSVNNDELLSSYVAQLRMGHGRCTAILENSRGATCFALAGHAQGSGGSIGITVRSHQEVWSCLAESFSGDAKQGHHNEMECALVGEVISACHCNSDGVQG